MDDILVRLRAPSNWLRQDRGSQWKDGVSQYDRAPFEAADEIERLRAMISASWQFIDIDDLREYAKHSDNQGAKDLIADLGW